MLKKVCWGRLSPCSLLGPGAFAQKQQVMLDKVVAVVGSSSILHSEVAGMPGSSRPSAVPKDIHSDRDPMNEALRRH